MMDGWMYHRCINVRMDTCINEWMDGWIYRNWYDIKEMLCCPSESEFSGDFPKINFTVCHPFEAFLQNT